MIEPNPVDTKWLWSRHGSSDSVDVVSRVRIIHVCTVYVEDDWWLMFYSHTVFIEEFFDNS